MKVRKRSGALVPFSPEKIKSSVGRASDEIHMPLNDGDLNMVAKQVEDQIKKEYDHEVSFRAVHMMVLANLNALGFSAIADAYDRMEQL